jgi:sulfur-oxidizing protein SoxZ
MALARITIPSTARIGEIITVRLVIQHPMETGFRVEADGKVIPKNVINHIVCRYAGREVWRAQLSSGIAANPYFEFMLRADISGDVEFSWLDDERQAGEMKSRLNIVPA